MSRPLRQAIVIVLIAPSTARAIIVVVRSGYAAVLQDHREPFRDPDTMLKYLTRYTHRVALSNDRLSAYDGSHVSVSYKDYADGCRRKEMRLPCEELLRRFCLHIVPKGMVRIRHYGILSNRDHGQRLAKCRDLLKAQAPSPVLAASANASSPSPRTADKPSSSVLGMSPTAAFLGTWTVLAAMTTPAALSASPSTVPPPPSSASRSSPCPKCGAAEGELLWFGERPRGRDWQRIQPWNTS